MAEFCEGVFAFSVSLSSYFVVMHENEYFALAWHHIRFLFPTINMQLLESSSRPLATFYILGSIRLNQYILDTHKK